MGKVLSFGELLLRICPDMDGQWLQENTLPFYVGGAEANVAAALSLWGVPSSYLTALPGNFLSDQVVSYLNSRAIQTDKILYHGNRMGLYYLPKGNDLKNAGVLYDRSGSAFADLSPGLIDWDDVFEDVSWFHFSAICPALSQAVAEVCEEALVAARRKNITISLDLNYRAKLWQYGKAPLAVMPALAQHCHLIMGNIWAAHTMLGIPLDEELIAGRDKESLLQHARLSSAEVIRQFPNCRTVANTFRFDHGDAGIRYYTTLYANAELTCSREYMADKIVDKVGSGDCFMAGLIYGFYKNLPLPQTLEFATAAAFKKLFTLGDATNSTVAEIQETMSSYAK